MVILVEHALTGRRTSFRSICCCVTFVDAVAWSVGMPCAESASRQGPASRAAVELTRGFNSKVSGDRAVGTSTSRSVEFVRHAFAVASECCASSNFSLLAHSSAPRFALVSQALDSQCERPLLDRTCPAFARASGCRVGTSLGLG